MKVMPVKPPDKGLCSRRMWTLPFHLRLRRSTCIISSSTDATSAYPAMRSSGIFWICTCGAYVRSGSLHTFCGEQSANATAGQLVLMDCRLPHRYYVTEPTEFLWFHFSGGESAAYVRLLTGGTGASALTEIMRFSNILSRFSTTETSRCAMSTAFRSASNPCCAVLPCRTPSRIFPR